MSTKPLVVEPELREEIEAAINQFDLHTDLTEEELRMMGQSPTPEQIANFKPAQHIEEDKFETNTEPVASETDYNARYAYYLKCQSIVDLISFKEGWDSFGQLVLKPFLVEQKQANREYRGTNPNDAFALRLREQCAEDFITFIDAVIEDLKAVPKPVLKQQK